MIKITKNFYNRKINLRKIKAQNEEFVKKQQEFEEMQKQLQNKSQQYNELSIKYMEQGKILS